MRVTNARAASRLLGRPGRSKLWIVAAIVVMAGFLLLGGRIDPPGPGERGFVQAAVELILLLVYVLAGLVSLRWAAMGTALMAGAAVSIGVASSVWWGLAFTAPPALRWLDRVGAFDRLSASTAAGTNAEGTKEVRRSLVIALAACVLGGFGVYRLDRFVFGPKHPQSHTPALRSSTVRWMWAGGVTDRTATVVAALNGPADRGPLAVAGTAIEPTSIAEDVVRYELSDLDADTVHRYSLGDAQGSFRTMPSGPASFRVAIGGDARTGSNGAVFDTIRSMHPALYLVNGDFFYGDIPNDDPGLFRRDYDTTLTRPAQAALYREVSVAYVWDDHDFGPDNTHGDSPSAPAAQQVYRSVVPHYPLPAGEGIHQAFTIGRVRFVLTDGRSYRTDQTMLGPEQIEWLESELATVAPDSLVVLVVGTAWVVRPKEGADDWGGYADEQSALIELIDRHTTNALVVAGDAHMIAIDDGTNSPGRYPVFHATALDKRGNIKGGPYSEGAIAGAGQFGTIDVDDDGRTIDVTLTGWNWKGERLMTWSTSFA